MDILLYTLIISLVHDKVFQAKADLIKNVFGIFISVVILFIFEGYFSRKLRIPLLLLFFEGVVFLQHQRCKHFMNRNRCEEY